MSLRDGPKALDLGAIRHRRELRGPETEVCAVGAAALEHPRQVGLDVEVALLGGADHTEQGGPAVRAVGAAREQARQAQFRMPLELALARTMPRPGLCRIDARAA